MDALPELWSDQESLNIPGEWRQRLQPINIRDRLSAPASPGSPGICPACPGSVLPAGRRAGHRADRPGDFPLVPPRRRAVRTDADRAAVLAATAGAGGPSGAPGAGLVKCSVPLDEVGEKIVFRKTTRG